MNKKEYKFLDNRLLELVDNNIISTQQYMNAQDYYKNKRTNKSIATILGAIGVFLMALSIITLFAINWQNISKGIKVTISFIPLIVTSILLYFSIQKDSKKVKLYTSIFAPISIIATNSLIAQVFHIQTEIYELIFTSLIMFLPIAFILRNYISIVVYGVGTVIYSFTVISSLMNEGEALFRIFIIALPNIIFNIKNYIDNKDDGKNIVMWIVNASLITLFVFYKEIFTANVLIVYLYLLYLVTLTLFGRENGLSKIFSLLFTLYLIISCTTPYMVAVAEEIECGFDTLIVSIITAIFIYVSSIYKDKKEYFTLIFVFLLQYTKMPMDVLFVFVNIIAIAFGVYKIIIGNKQGLYKEIKQGIAIILIVILFRFINADLSFMEKSVMFLIAGAGFIVGSKIVKKKNRRRG